MPNPFEQPSTADWMRPHERSLREEAPTYLEKVLRSGLLDHREIHEAVLFPDGVSSVVYRVSFEGGSAVIKMAPEGGDLQADAQFFSTCEQAGIKVPHLLSYSGPSQEIPVSLMVMEYIDAVPLSKSFGGDPIPEEKLRELGRTQAMIHSIKGSGFGHLDHTGNGKLGSLEEQMRAAGIWDRAEVLRAKGLLSVSPEDIDRAVGLLSRSVNPEQTSLTHNDLLPYNVFDTDPLTVFDPQPRFSHPYTCLAMTMVKSRAQETGTAQSRGILAGYEEVSPVDREALNAAILLRYIHASYGRDRKGETIGKELSEVLLDLG